MTKWEKALFNWLRRHKAHGATHGYNYGDCRKCDVHVIAHAGKGTIRVVSAHA